MRPESRHAVGTCVVVGAIPVPAMGREVVTIGKLGARTGSVNQCGVAAAGGGLLGDRLFAPARTGAPPISSGFNPSPRMGRPSRTMIGSSIGTTTRC